MVNGGLYKWEDNNHGLEHKCGTCKTVLSSPRAKKTCFGDHEEVCTKYHKTLFYLGNSHKCDACGKSRELHDKRHREIAALLQQIQTIDKETGIESPLTKKKGKILKSDVFRFFEPECETFDCAGFVDPDMEVEWANSSTMCSLEDDRDSKTMPTSNTKENKLTKKTQKAEKKMVHNQTRLRIISREDMQSINDSLHPSRSLISDRTNRLQSSDSLVNNSTVAAGIAFNTRTFIYSALRTAVHEKKLAKATGTPKTLCSTDHSIILSAILLKLGVVLEVQHAPKNRKVLIARLGGLIQADLLAVENEDRDTMMRMAGYWRYVNKRTYNAMIKQNELWDWNTGQKLEEIEEDEEEEEEENQQLAAFKETDQAIVQPIDGKMAEPECYDDDFVFMSEALQQVFREPIEDQDILNFKGVKDTRHLCTKSGNRTPRVAHKLMNNAVNKSTGKLANSMPVATQLTGNPPHSSTPDPSATDPPDLQPLTLQISSTSLASYSSVVKSSSVSEPTTPVTNKQKIFTLPVPPPIEDDAPEAEGWTKVARGKKGVPARQLPVRSVRRGK